MTFWCDILSPRWENKWGQYTLTPYLVVTLLSEYTVPQASRRGRGPVLLTEAADYFDRYRFRRSARLRRESRTRRPLDRHHPCALTAHPAWSARPDGSGQIRAG